MADITVQHQFEEIVCLIQNARTKALQAVNSELINLYRQVGKYISSQVAPMELYVRGKYFFYKQIAPMKQM